MRRRELIKAGFGSLLAAACAQKQSGKSEATMNGSQSTQTASPTPWTSGPMPTIFLAHGAPPTLEDDAWLKSFREWSKAMPTPKAVLMISAHWVSKPVTLGATKTVPLVYDYYGFPEKYYEVQYPAPGAPDVADRVDALMGAPLRRKERGLDHGAFIPMIGMYPDANVPTLTMSIPTMEPKELFELGKKLAPLRDEGVLIVGSGFITHNLGAVDFRNGPPPSWAKEFDAYIADAITRGDADAILAYREKAPGVRESLPTHEHFVPLVVAMGAASVRSLGKTSFPIDGFVFGPMTKRSVQWS
jgi:4,5-DOPA dioxygenase extradiol